MLSYSIDILSFPRKKNCAEKNAAAGGLWAAKGGGRVGKGGGRRRGGWSRREAG